MWNRISGKSHGAKDDAPDQRSRHSKSERNSNSVVSSNVSKKSLPIDDNHNAGFRTKFSSRGDDRDRSFNSISSSYSSTTQSAYPGVAGASVATASRNHDNEPYIPAGLMRSASLADQMPKSKTSRDSNRDKEVRSERRRNRDDYEIGRDRSDEPREMRRRRGKEHREHDGESSRAPADFPDQVGAEGFSQFPGQFGGGASQVNGHTADRPMSSHVQDQFPGQFPVQSTGPYRPPIAISEGGPGLAAEYYGDAGNSVAEQPGVRTNTPSLIIGAEPHLLPASAVVAPPPEPSASGGVGAAASFFSGEFDYDQSATHYDQHDSSTYATAQTRPNGSHHSSSAPVLPTIGGAVLESAAGYITGNQIQMHDQRPQQTSSVNATHTHEIPSGHHRPPSPTAETYYSNTSRPPRPDKESSHSSNIPMYAAGAAGLAAGAYQQNHHSSSYHSSTRPQYQAVPMAQRHHHHGPFRVFVDFFKDPDGVAQYEEYSEFIGVCRKCFAPGSSPRDAPRKHHYRKRRSNESLGRVDKESRYHSSENESRRKKGQSWLASGLAGYGWAKVGENLFKQKNDFDDTYSVKTGHRVLEDDNHRIQRRRRSKDRIEAEFSSNERICRKDSQTSIPGTETQIYRVHRRSRSRSHSSEPKSKTTSVDLTGGTATAMAGSSSLQRKHVSPKGSTSKSRYKKEEKSLHRRSKSHKKKKSRGFFSFGSASSSTSSVNLIEDSHRRRDNARNGTKSKDDKKAEAALIGLSAAAAALAVKDSRINQKKRDVKKLVGVKETSIRYDLDRKDNRVSDEEVWESAPEEGYESIDSGLAYGTKRRSSRDSLSSQSSGTDKWDWRWGSRKQEGPSRKQESSTGASLSPVGDAAGSSLNSATVMSPGRHEEISMDCTSGPPLQQVFPMPTSDPTRFDVGLEGAPKSPERPAAIPIQHPQPRTPVSTALYSNRPRFEQSYTVPAVVANPQRSDQVSGATVADVRYDEPDPDFSGRFGNPKLTGVSVVSEPRRRDSSPAKFHVNTTTDPVLSRRRSSVKDDASTVRFDRTEEQEEDDRRERRRQRKEEREKREAEERNQVDKERIFAEEKRSRRSDSDVKQESSPNQSSVNSWVVPAVAGAVAATAGAVAMGDKPRSEETREERRERRRREREHEEQEDEEATRRRERRRRDRESAVERDAEEATGEKYPTTASAIPEGGNATKTQSRKSVSGGEKSIWQEAASPKRSISYENYGDFFRPLDLGDDQVKVTSANADADADLDQTPAIVTVAPKHFRRINAEPEYSPADTDEQVDTSTLPFPVPKLRLVEPSPPSSRGSTPVSQPQDIVEGSCKTPAEGPPSSKVTWGEDHTTGHVIVSSSEGRTHREILNEDIVDIPEPQPSPEQSSLGKERVTVDKSANAENHTTSPSNNEDVVFAATLAASAEDAGFDPSIVIDDPKYRRRDSPPGSIDRSMPGRFDDIDDISRLSKKERKKRDRTAKSRNDPDGPWSRDSDVIVNDIINQIEHPEAEVEKFAIDGFDDGEKSSKKTKSKKSKKGRDNSSTKDEFFDATDTPIKDQESNNRKVLDVQSEHAVQEDSVTPRNIKKEDSKKSRKTSRRNGNNPIEAESTVPLPSTVSGSDNTTSKASRTSKSSVWDRVLNRSSVNMPQKTGSKDPVDAADKEGPQNSEENNIDDGDPKIHRGLLKGDEATFQSNGKDEIKDKQFNAGDGPQDSGRITQNLPAKVPTPAARGGTQTDDMLIHSKDQDRNYQEPSDVAILHDEAASHEPQIEYVQQPESFLDMRPEPPPPPDTPVQSSKSVDLLEASDPPGSPNATPKRQTGEPSKKKHQGYSEPSIPEPLSSPTAVPFDFRFSRPRPSLGSARSMSVTRLPTSSSPIHTPRPKPRPRSTEFTSSKEFRPLMLVERHRPHQELANEETYPSLPSSHTTSRGSSLHDPNEGERGNYEMVEASHSHNHDRFDAELESPMNADHSLPQAGLLDSQQATPIASSFQNSVKDEVPSSVHDDNSFAHGNVATPMFGGISENAGAGDVPPFGTRKLSDSGDLPSFKLPPEEQDDLQKGLDAMGQNPGADLSKSDGIAKADIIAGEGAVMSEISFPQEVLRLQKSKAELVATSPPGQRDKINDESSWNPGVPAGENFLPFAREECITGSTPENGIDDDVEGEAVPDSKMEPAEDFPLQKTKKGKKSKRESGKTSLIKTRATPPISDAADKPDDKLPNRTNPEEERRLHEQDAQDAVDSWFTPAVIEKKDRKKKKKGASEQSYDTTKPRQISEKMPDSSGLPQHSPETRDLTEVGREMPFDQVPRQMKSSTDASGEAEEILLQPLTPSAQASTTRQLVQRQGKSKGKKAKRDRYSTSRENSVQLNSQKLEILDPSDPMTEQQAIDKSDSLKATAIEAPEKGGAAEDQTGEKKSLYFGAPPEAIPLPLSDDLELQAESPLNSEIYANIKPSRPEPIPSPLSASDQSLSQKTDENLKQPLSQHFAISEETQKMDYVSAQRSEEEVDALEGPISGSSVGDKKTEIGEGPPPAQDRPVKASLDLESGHDEKPLDIQQNDVRLVDDDWAEFGGKKKGKKAKKAKASSRAIPAAAVPEVEIRPQSALSDVAALTAPSANLDEPETTAEKLIYGATPQKVVGSAHDEPGSFEDEWVDPQNSKKGKKGQKAKKSGGWETTTGADTEPSVDVPIFKTDENTEIKDPALSQVIGRSREEREVPLDEWTGFSNKKKGKKAKKGKTASTDVGVAAESTAWTSQSVPSEEAHKDEQVQETAHSFDLNFQGQPEVADDEWASFDSKKKGKKNRKANTKTREINAKSLEHDTAEDRTDGPKDAEPNGVEPCTTTTRAQEIDSRLVEPKEGQPERSKPESVEQEQLQPGVFERTEVKPEIQEPDAIEPRTGRLEESRALVVDPETNFTLIKPKAGDIGRVESESPQPRSPPMEMSKPETKEIEEHPFTEIESPVTQSETAKSEIYGSRLDESREVGLERYQPDLVEPLSEPVVNNEQRSKSIGSDEINTILATTMTSQEVATILSMEKSRLYSDNDSIDKPSSAAANVNDFQQEQVPNQDVCDGEHIPSRDEIPTEAGRDFEGQETELIEQFDKGNDFGQQESALKETYVTLTNETEAQELELINQYAKSAENRATSGAVTAALDAAEDNRPLPEVDETVEMPSHDVEAGTETFIPDAKAHDKMAENPESIMEGSHEKTDTQRQENGDPLLNRSEWFDHHETHPGLAQEQEESDHGQPVDNDTKEELLIHPPQVPDSTQLLASVDPQMTVGGEPGAAGVDESFPHKVLEKQKNEAIEIEKSPRDPQASNKSSLQDAIVEQAPNNDGDDDSKDFRIQPESRSLEKVDQSGLGLAIDQGPSESIEQPERREGVDLLLENEPEALRQSQPSKKKKDKKKAKKAKSTAWQEEGEPPIVSNDQAIQDTLTLQSERPEATISSVSDAVKDTGEFVQARPESKDDRKNQKRIESPSPENAIPSDSDTQMHPDNGITGNQHDGFQPGEQGVHEEARTDYQPRQDYERSGHDNPEDDQQARPQEPVILPKSPEPPGSNAHGSNMVNQSSTSTSDFTAVAASPLDQALIAPNQSKEQISPSESSARHSLDADGEAFISEKKSRKAKRKGKKSQTATSDEIGTKNELVPGRNEPLTEETQIEPYAVPSSGANPDLIVQHVETEKLTPKDEPDSSKGPPITQDYEAKLEDGPTSIDKKNDSELSGGESGFVTAKKSKKGKKSKKTKWFASDEAIEPTSTESTANPPPATDLTGNRTIILRNPSESETDLPGIPSSILEGNSLPSVSEAELIKDSQEAEAREVDNERPEDEPLDVPAKKKKKNKKGRRMLLTYDDTESLGLSSSQPSQPSQRGQGTTELASDVQASPKNESIESKVLDSHTESPGGELLDPVEKHNYDIRYAHELERQGDESLLSSKDDLPPLRIETELAGSQGQSSPERVINAPYQQQASEDLDSSTIHSSEQRLENEAFHAQELLEPDQQYPTQAEIEPLKTPPAVPTEVSSVAIENESPNPLPQPDHDQGRVVDFEGAESEPSLIPEDVLTPSADTEMLNAQEQQEYDSEYAKELERQLSPPEEKRSESPSNEVHPPSNSLPSIDSLVGLPLEQRTPLAKPPPLEDIIEEPRSRPGSVQEGPKRNDEKSPLPIPKKSKKGKKGKKQQQPIIWEDETATPSADTEAHRVMHAHAESSNEPFTLVDEDTTLPIDLEEPIEQQHVQEEGCISPLIVQGTKGHDQTDDYFTIQTSKLVEEDRGRNPENEDFRHSLSDKVPFSNQEYIPEQGDQVSSESNEHFLNFRKHDNSLVRDSLDSSHAPLPSSTQSREEPDEEFSSERTKRGKKGKKGKKRESEKASAVESEQSLEQFSQRSPIIGVVGHTSKPLEQSSREKGGSEDEPTLRDEKDIGKTDKRGDFEELVAPADLGAAELAAEGILRQDSKKGGKKGKKGKKAKWADFDQEAPNLESRPVVGEKSTNTNDKIQSLEQESTATVGQELPITISHSAHTSTITEPTSRRPGFEHGASRTEDSMKRDSAINISESPLIPSESLVHHHHVRDSGYPETEASPILGRRESYEDSRTIDTDTFNDQTLPRGRSPTDDQQRPSTHVDLSHDTSVSEPRERHRRSRSYDSDDSADSGFDVQRRRRRQAMQMEAHEPSPVSSTTKDRSSALFDSSPSTRQGSLGQRSTEHQVPGNESIHQEPPTWSFDRGGSPQPNPTDASDKPTARSISESVPDPSTYSKLTGYREEPSGSLFGGPVHSEVDRTSRSESPPINETRGRLPTLKTISEDGPEKPTLHAKDKRPLSDVGSPEAGVKERRIQSPSTTIKSENRSWPEQLHPHAPESVKEHHQENNVDYEGSQSSKVNDDSSRPSDLSTLANPPPKQRDGEHRTASAASMRSDNSIHAIIRTPDQIRSASGQSFRSSGTPPLRRVDRSASGDLRGASKLGQAKARAKTSDPELDSDFNNLPSSSTYDPVTDKGKSRAEMAGVYEDWGDVRGQSPMSPTRPPSMRKRQSMQILDLETRLDQLISENRLLQSQRTSAENNLQDQSHNHSQQRHAYEEALQEHKAYLAQKDSELNELRAIVDEWQSKVDQLAEVNDALTSSRALNEEYDQRYRDLEDEHTHLKERHTDLTTGMEALVQREVASHLEAKNSELQQLRAELDSAKQQVQSLQHQLIASRESEDFIERDEDYFEGQCQSLCQHVQQWVLRFSKFSDMKACYRASEIRDETKVDRMENAILDGTDVDTYLQDRVKRRDVFMAVVMTMIFDYIFTRYLFGMDREQRQKLKSLEKTLQEIGPMSAVCKWRATTLTLLMKREDFARQRVTDTEAIVHEIYDTLATFLPPPSHLVGQIQDSLRKVITAAADLSMEMRTQRSDYQMLPPLQPDYDTNGDLAQKVYFNALTMNERSGATTSNQALQEQGAVVRMVLFPLVVKNEEDDEQIIVCPAQVLTANSKGKKTVRVMSVQGSMQGGGSEASLGDMNMEGGMI